VIDSAWRDCSDAVAAGGIAGKVINNDAEERDLTMPVEHKSILGALVLSFAAMALQPTGAQAITVEVAKKCNVLSAKQFPPRQAGNPAAGSSKGSAKDQREFFKKCVDNNGNIDGADEKK
jgi:hypothetical protein